MSSIESVSGGDVSSDGDVRHEVKFNHNQLGALKQLATDQKKAMTR